MGTHRTSKASSSPKLLKHSIWLDGDVITATYGIRLSTTSNTGGGWKSKHDHSKSINIRVIQSLAERFGWPRAVLRHFPKELMVAVRAKAVRRHEIDPPLNVTITRCAPRKLDDDNLVSSAKPVIDAVARWLGVDDGRSDLVKYAVEYEKAELAGFRIRIQPR